MILYKLNIYSQVSARDEDQLTICKKLISFNLFLNDSNFHIQASSVHKCSLKEI